MEPDRVSGKYFAATQGLEWFATTPEKVNDVPGVIEIWDWHPHLLYSSRYNITKNGKNFQVVGFAWPERQDVFYWDGTKVQKVPANGKIEILRCNPATSVTVRKY